MQPFACRWLFGFFLVWVSIKTHVQKEFGWSKCGFNRFTPDMGCFHACSARWVPGYWLFRSHSRGLSVSIVSNITLSLIIFRQFLTSTRQKRDQDTRRSTFKSSVYLFRSLTSCLLRCFQLVSWLFGKLRQTDVCVSGIAFVPSKIF